MELKRKVLVTGGCGYIGSHTVVELLDEGYDVHIVDNLCNSSPNVLKRLERITGVEMMNRFSKFDLRDSEKLNALFESHHFDMVIHFAALKAVGESVAKPLLYYENNLIGTLVLLRTMENHGCKNIVFSSSACVYGDADPPVTETSPANLATNPYGFTKSFMEQIMTDQALARGDWKVILLRYFNPVGSHSSALIGEDPTEPNNIMPYILKVAIGDLPILNVFGNDYDTKDGTGVRDYIHIVDLAKGHTAALRYAASEMPFGASVFNLGTGTGYSVLELIETFSSVYGKPLPFKMAPRRAGDVCSLYADPSKAENVLGWKATLGIVEMCRDAWNWRKKNPQGFDTPI